MGETWNLKGSLVDGVELPLIWKKLIWQNGICFFKVRVPQRDFDTRKKCRRMAEWNRHSKANFLFCLIFHRSLPQSKKLFCFKFCTSWKIQSEISFPVTRGHFFAFPILFPPLCFRCYQATISRFSSCDCCLACPSRRFKLKTNLCL